MSSGRDAVAHQLEHLGADELGLRALAARLEQPHRAVRRPRSRAALEQPALEVVQRRPGGGGVVLGALVQRDHLGASGASSCTVAALPAERVPPGLVGERDPHVGLGEARQASPPRRAARGVSSSKP